MTNKDMNKEVNEVIANAKAKVSFLYIWNDKESSDYKKRKREFDRVMKNCQVVGNKKFSYVPIELLFVDKRFQRIDTSSDEKIKELAANFDSTLMDPIRVSVHKEKLSFSIIDGYHRYMAAIIAGVMDIECEIIELSDNDEERLQQEVNIFISQDLNREKLKATQKHKANLIKGTKANVILQNCLDKYKYEFNVVKDKYETCGLTGFTEALYTAKLENGSEVLNDVFKIIFHSGWHMAKSGFGNYAIIAIRGVLRLHWEIHETVVDTLINRLTMMDPRVFIANTMAAYPNRKERERLVMYLDNLVCTDLGITPVYFGGNISECINCKKKGV